MLFTRWWCSWVSKTPLCLLPTRHRFTPSPTTYTHFTSSLHTKTTKAKAEAKHRAKAKAKAKTKTTSLEKEKRRTRSDKEHDIVSTFNSLTNDNENHVPVMLGEVLDVFSSSAAHLRSFVDCTLGAAGHSFAVIESHPELRHYIGMDVDPTAHENARARLDSLIRSRPQLNGRLLLENFRRVKSVITEVDQELSQSGVDAILMDLGMSSMQVNDPERGFSVLADGPLDMRMDPRATLRAEDILNSWPDTEVARVLREYGEESNWRFLQKKIVEARLHGGLHSTSELVDLIRVTTHGTRGGRQGWIKTATRVFQALRIAVNDELNVLEKSLNACFECLAPGGRLAVISFHSLEDRIVKQTFINIIQGDRRDENDQTKDVSWSKIGNGVDSKETWIKQTVQGQWGTILTKRPITPCAEEETLNRRSRSAKLRVIEKSL